MQVNVCILDLDSTNTKFTKWQMLNETQKWQCIMHIFAVLMISYCSTHKNCKQKRTILKLFFPFNQTALVETKGRLWHMCVSEHPACLAGKYCGVIIVVWLRSSFLIFVRWPYGSVHRDNRDIEKKNHFMASIKFRWFFLKAYLYNIYSRWSLCRYAH